MGKPILLDRVQLAGALACVSKNEDRYVLQAINIRPTDVEASNGHVLVRIPHAGADVNEFPLVEGAPTEAPDAPFLLPADLAAAVLKTLPRKQTLPILEYAKVGTRKESVIVATTDMNTASAPSARLPEGAFPNADRVLLKRSKPLFALRISELERLCKVGKASGMGTPVLMFYTPKDQDSAIRVDIPLGDARQAEAVIMPMRANWPEAEEVEAEVSTKG